MGNDFLKNAYYALEDKYYALLDKIPAAYKIVDPIDRVIPSFFLFALVIVLLVVFGAYIALGAGGLAGQEVSITVLVHDAQGNALPNALVTIDGFDPIQTNELGVTAIPVRVARGTLVPITVEKRDFETRSVTLEAEETSEYRVQLSPVAPDTRTRRILLQNSIGQNLKARATLSFSCTERGAVPTPQTAEYAGTALEIAVPENCGVLQATIDAQGYQSLQGVAVTGNVIRLQEDASALGTVRLQVTYNGAPVGGIRVQRWHYEVGPIGTPETTDSGGIVEFTTVSGKYTLRTSATGEYASGATEEFFLGEGQTIEKTLELSQNNVDALIRIKTVKKTTKTGVAGARVTVSRNNTQVGSGVTSADENYTVEIPVSAIGNYTVTADHAEYLSGSTKVAIENGGVEKTVTFEMERFDPNQAGTLKVEVRDAETGKGVRNARVALFKVDADGTETLAAEYPHELSDVNGIARFPRVKNGTYKAVAVKGAARAYTTAAFFDVREQDQFLLESVLEIPRGTVRLVVRDPQGNPVPNAQVELYDDLGNLFIARDLTDANGTWTLSADSVHAKADKDVYAVVSRQALAGETDFADYTTLAKPILPNQVQVFNITVTPKRVAGDLTITPRGLWLKNEQVGAHTSPRRGTSGIARSVSPGGKYTARYQIIVPEGDSYRDVVVMLRVGDAEITEKDPAVIQKTNFPLGGVFTRGTSYKPENGYDIDISRVTLDDAKWVRIAIPVLNAGVYDLAMDVKVKENVTVGQKVPLHYRIHGTRAGTPEYYPLQATPPEDEFYATPKTDVYQVGTSTLCTSEFCFDATIIEVETGIGESVTDTFDAEINREYRLVFNVSNNNPQKIHANDTLLEIENRGNTVLFGQYTLTDAQGLQITGTSGGASLPDVSTGTLRADGPGVGGEILFVPTASGNAPIAFTVVSSTNAHNLLQRVYQKTITLNVRAQKQLNATYAPESLATGIENTINVTVTEGTRPLYEVNVNLRNRDGEIVGSAQTDREGKAQVTTPVLLPQEEITLLIQKAGYDTRSYTLLAQDAVIETEPQEIGVTLNAITEPQASIPIAVRNTAGFPLQIARMQYTGNSRNLLDETRINNALAAFDGTTLDAGEQLDATFASYLSDLGRGVTQREQLSGNLEITTTNYGESWTTLVPVATTIGLGADVDDETCLKVFVAGTSQKEWVMSTEGKTVQTELVIQNNCTVDGNPVAISDLEAQVNWAANEVGTMSLAIYDEGRRSGTLGAADLRDGYYQRLTTRMNANKTYTGILTFSPYGGVNAVSKATVRIRARNQQDGLGTQYLEEEVGTTIHIIDLAQCLSFSSELINITKEPKTGAATTEFTVENKEDCGPIQVYLNTELEVSPTEFEIEAGSTQDVAIDAGDALLGQYAIRVDAEAPGQASASEVTSLLEKNRFIRVRIYDPENCIQLDRYEFNVYEQIDEAELINQCRDKEATFRVDEKSFTNALLDGAKWGLITSALGSVVSKLEGRGWSGTETAADRLAAEAQRAVAAKQALSQFEQGTSAATTFSVGSLDQSIADHQFMNHINPAQEQREPSGPGERLGSTVKYDEQTGVYTITENAPQTQPINDQDIPSQPIPDQGAPTNAPQPTADPPSGTQPTPTTEPQGSQDPPQGQGGATYCTITGAGTGTLKDLQSTANDVSACLQKLDKTCNAKQSAGAGAAEQCASERGIAITVIEVLEIESAATQGQFEALDGTLTTNIGIQNQAIQNKQNARQQGTTAQKQAKSSVSDASAALAAQANAQIDASIQKERAALQRTQSVQNRLQRIRQDADATEDIESAKGQVAAKNFSGAADQIRQYTNRVKQASADMREEQDAFEREVLNNLEESTTAMAQAEAQTKDAFNNAQSANTPDIYQGPPAPAQLQQNQPQGFFGGGGMGILGPVAGLVVPGNPQFMGGLVGDRPWSQGLGVFLGRTFFAYDDQEVVSFNIRQPDLEIRGIKVTPARGVDTEDPSVNVTWSNAAFSADLRVGSPLRTETRGLRFEQNGLASGTHYKVLSVTGTRHYYAENKVYKLDDLPTDGGGLLSTPRADDVETEKIRLDEEEGSPKPFDQKFHVQFNNLSPEERIEEATPPIGPDCIAFSPPGLNGRTGPGVAPRIKLAWGWGDIQADSCDATNPDYIYCDATQFSIAVMKKMSAVQEFLEDNRGVLRCPSAEQELGTCTNVVGADDVGVSRVHAQKRGNDANVQVEIENTGSGIANVTVTVNVFNTNTLQQQAECTRTARVDHKATVGCNYTALPNAVYGANVQIEVDGADNTSLTSDACNTATFSIGTESLIPQCTPYDTSRLASFIEATEEAGIGLNYPGGSKNDFLSNLHFDAYLIKDRYSPDFVSDFGDYYTNQEFAGAPADFKDETGLLRMMDPETYRVRLRYGESANTDYLREPGLHEANLEIAFQNDQWEFFNQNGEREASVLVALKKSPVNDANPPDSAFYYMPFDGLVGTTAGQDGRTGYGVRYEGEIIPLNNASIQTRTLSDASWTPFEDADGTVDTQASTTFKKANVDERGQVLIAERGKLKFVPTLPTPTILHVQNDTGEACVSYDFGINGDDTYTGLQSNPWWGIGAECRDFSDKSMLDEWRGTFDKSNQTTGAFETVCGSHPGTVYGLEWADDQQKRGNVYLKTIFYTPAGDESTANIVLASDNASFSTPEQRDVSSVGLTGAGVNTTLNSVHDVLAAVERGDICVQGSGLRQTFYWNASRVMNELTDLEQSAQTACIR